MSDLTSDVLAVLTGANLPTKKKKKSGSGKPWFWANECKYSVILNVATEADWKLIEDEKLETRCNLFWIDVASIHEHFRTIKPWQCINHFPGMPNIARKNRMGQALNSMQKVFPKEYSFYPRTWVLPLELPDFRQQFDSTGNSLNGKIFIIKPDAGCQGRGIFLTRTLDNIPMTESVVAQVYIKKPLLIDGFKFDLRIYVIVTSVKPLRMFLFQDGLVRMCTEEYVKPTKQNIGMMCMHLTNYAVNKHNDNFQQPTATGSSNDEDGSKRSLQWFMNYIRKEHSDAKADWLWRRIGTLCTRTVLSIMPILSKEYDTVFKSFHQNIPVDINKIQSLTSSIMPPAGVKQARGRSGAPSRTATTTSNNEDDNNESEDEDNDNHSSHSDNQDVSTDDTGPKMRGSRCFEVLGFDIMLDTLLNPWLIEVNHLPSFGTDSALDRDIKERLMKQVFAVLATKNDDEKAYNAFHKAEAEKRLIAQIGRDHTVNKENKEREKNKIPMMNKRPMGLSGGSNTGNGNGARPENRQGNRDPSAANPNRLSNNKALAEREREAPVESKTDAEEQQREQQEETATDDQLQTQEIPQESQQEEERVQPLSSLDPIDEECTPQRLQEIKTILLDIYAKYSPEKVSKIDRLLNKYIGHEEEFLQFVFEKYQVSPFLYEPQLKKASNNEALENKGTAVPLSTKPREINTMNAGASTTNTTTTPMSKRYSRSLSPPRSITSSISGNSNASSKQQGNNAPPTDSSTTRRASAIWRTTAPEEELAFKQEVLSIHIPASEADEWLRFETSRLNLCTRIFPLPSYYRATSQGERQSESRGESREISANNAMTNNEEEAEENTEDNNNDDNGETEVKQTAASTTTANTAIKAKSATYEEILYQVFLQDRRQTMRMTRPLPNRAKMSDDTSSMGSFLPSINNSESSKSSNSMIGSGKGVVGWKAPPKPVARSEPIKQPTAVQTESARRLSQGLSVKNGSSKGGRNIIDNSASNVQYSVVLDPQEYNTVYGQIPLQQHAQLQQQSQAVYTNGQDVIYPSTKAHRHYEESRSNRLRIEQTRSNNAAPLRQQVFYFDPNYESYQPSLVIGQQLSLDNAVNSGNTSSRTTQNGDAPNASATATGTTTPTMAANPNPLLAATGTTPSWKGKPTAGSMSTTTTTSGSSMKVAAYPGPGLGSSSVISSSGQNVILGANGMYFVQPGQSQLQGQAQAATAAAIMAARAAAVAGGSGPRGMILPATQQMPPAGAVAAAAAVAGGSNNKQEELLRQLFPSWF